MHPYKVVKDFESALSEYTGAPYAVAVNSCTAALMLAVAWHLRKNDDAINGILGKPVVNIPKRTYVSVPMAIIHAGGKPTFRDEDWLGAYQLLPLPVMDCARRFHGDMYNTKMPWFPGHLAPPTFSRGMMCVSFHASKILGDTQGGAILHDNPEADRWLRRARFDGRAEGVAPIDDKFTQIGWHCYLSPDVAARLLLKLYSLPKHNEDLPNDNYPDLSRFDIFK